MPKCKNCYHYEVCSDIYDLDNMFEDCENFKDKSLIVELTHTIGDIVYEISNGEIYSLIILNAVITDNNIEFHCTEIVKENIDAYGDVDFGVAHSFSIFDINKTVFITREDAEKGLKND